MSNLIGQKVFINATGMKVFAQDADGNVAFQKNGHWYSKNEYSLINPKITKIIREWLHDSTGLDIFLEDMHLSGIISTINNSTLLSLPKCYDLNKLHHAMEKYL